MRGVVTVKEGDQGFLTYRLGPSVADQLPPPGDRRQVLVGGVLVNPQNFGPTNLLCHGLLD